MIHVCYGLHDRDGRYSKFTATSILSIFENVLAPPPSVTIHILHDNTLTQDNRDRFNLIAGRYGQIIKFYNVEKLCADKIQFLREKLSSVFTSRFSVGTFYRLMADKKMFQSENVSKLIYLDSDTIVNLDISELWNYSMENFSIAAVPEMQATRGYMIQDKYIINSGKVRLENYFCAGVAMLNLDRFEEKFFHKGIQWLLENSQAECFDQDILNYFFSTEYLKLPEKFDAFVGVALQLDNNILAKKIYHYSGLSLGFNMRNSFDRLFFNHFIKTPFFDLNFIEHTAQIMKQLYIEQKNFAVQVSALISGKERAFFCVPNEVEFARKNFNVKEDEEIIIADSNESIDRLIEIMKKSVGKKVFFIMVSYPIISAILKKSGFKEGTDFINAVFFLSDVQGYPMPTQGLIKLL